MIFMILATGNYRLVSFISFLYVGYIFLIKLFSNKENIIKVLFNIYSFLTIVWIISVVVLRCLKL